MKSIFRKLRSGQDPSAPASESAFFTTTLAAHGFMDPHTPPVPWEARAIEVACRASPCRRITQSCAPDGAGESSAIMASIAAFMPQPRTSSAQGRRPAPLVVPRHSR